jgi:hypothetical protein
LGGGAGHGGRNAERDFHGEKRPNDIHFSTTDPDARLFRRGDWKEAKLCAPFQYVLLGIGTHEDVATLLKGLGNEWRLGERRATHRRRYVQFKTVGGSARPGTAVATWLRNVLQSLPRRTRVVDRLYVNFFQPSFKLKKSGVKGPKVVKLYHAPATPFARAQAHPDLDPASKRRPNGSSIWFRLIMLMRAAA